MEALLSIPVSTSSICNAIFSPVTTVLLLSISLYHTYTTYQYQKSLNTNTKSNGIPMSLKLSFAFILNALWCQFTLVIMLASSISTPSFCKFISLSGPPSYCTYKLFMYLILTYRAKEYFSDSAFAYSVRRLRIWKGILIIWSIINTVATVIGSTISVSTDPEEIPQCQGIVFPPAIMSWLLLDAVAGSGCAYLLIKPLMKMSEMGHTNEFKRIAKKQAMLSGISVVTTWLALIAMAFTNMHMVFVSMDMLASTLCVLLMYSWNKWAYKILCCCCSSKKSVTKIDDVKNLEMVVGQSQEDVNQANKDDIPSVSTQNTAVIH